MSGLRGRFSSRVLATAIVVVLDRELRDLPDAAVGRVTWMMSLVTILEDIFLSAITSARGHRRRLDIVFKCDRHARYQAVAAVALL